MKIPLRLGLISKLAICLLPGILLMVFLVGWTLYGYTTINQIDRRISLIGELGKNVMSTALIAQRYSAAVEAGITDTVTENRRNMELLLVNIQSDLNQAILFSPELQNQGDEVRDQIRLVLDVPTDSAEELFEESGLLGDIAFEINSEFGKLTSEFGLQKESLQGDYQNWTAFVLLLTLVVTGGVLKVINHVIIQPLMHIEEFAGEISQGRLSRKLDITSADEIGQLAEALQKMNTSLRRVLTDSQNASAVIFDTSKNSAQENEGLSMRTTEQVQKLDETVKVMKEMTSIISESSDTAKNATKITKALESRVVVGSKLVNETVLAMDEISSSSNQINEITEIIDAIAFQTNLLALNASVEAARAGEQGKGFAVVAVEVRNLAQRSAESSKEIRKLIENSVEKVNAGSDLVNSSGDVLQEILNDVTSVSDMISNINKVAEVQTHKVAEANESINRVNEMLEKNSEMVENAANSSRNMEQQALVLEQSLESFQFTKSEEEAG